MSQRELFIVLAHAQWCNACRQRLTANPEAVLLGRALSAAEKEALAKLTDDDFLTPERLARAIGVTVSQLDAYAHHPIARLRHF